MTSPLISIIVPVYNAGTFIEHCIDSILKQTLREIEVIAINDGSSDESATILNRLAAKDQRLRVFHQCNKGVSATRNVGLVEARGAYIGFVDSDDWVEPNMYEQMYHAAINQNADWVICNARVNFAGQSSKDRLKLANETIQLYYCRATQMYQLMRFKYDFANWNKMYSRKIIQQHQLMFNENMKVGEDLLFNCCYLQYSLVLSIIDHPYYHYRVHETSVMGNSQHDEIEEYNKLFINFHTFFEERRLDISLKEFEIEMRRGFYYSVIPRLVAKVKETEKAILNRVILFSNLLLRANKGLFTYTKNELGVGIQAYLKYLLKTENYKFFSILKFFKPF